MFQLNCSSCMAFEEVGPCGIHLGPNITFDCCACSASIITTKYTGKFDKSVITALRVPADEVDNPLMQRWWRQGPPTQALAAR